MEQKKESTLSIERGIYMYDLNSKFKTFYGKHVVLPKENKQELYDKKNLNIKRLKEGLKEYNEEKGTNYKLAEEPVVQGSVAMSTVTKNETNNYDIDIAIIFEKDELPVGTTATKNIVVNALKRKCTQLKKEPEAKTNCVRIEYRTGYHLDFAVYRRFKDEDDNYVYEHCGSEWRERNPRSITQWFLNQNKANDYKLREIVRLLKIFCKSRTDWVNMPGGLILSVLADEKYESYERMDERFYYTVKAIKDRLSEDKEVYNPTDETKSLKFVSKDDVKMTNLYNRLNDKLSKLAILFDEKCTEYQAIEAWEAFFNHSYWTKEKEGAEAYIGESTIFASKTASESQGYYDYRETEEFIEYLMPVNIDSSVTLSLNCKVIKDSRFISWLREMHRNGQKIIPDCQLEFVVSTSACEPYDTYWKVKNSGDIAKRTDDIRGQIFKKSDNKNFHTESAKFGGNHFVECYIVKKGICIAKERIHVHIN